MIPAFLGMSSLQWRDKGEDRAFGYWVLGIVVYSGNAGVFIAISSVNRLSLRSSANSVSL